MTPMTSVPWLTHRRIHLLWAVLAAATLLSYALGEASTGQHAEGRTGMAWPMAAAVYALAVTKGWLVIDQFMGLRHAPRLWRGVMLGWLLAVTATLLVLRAVG